MTKLTMSVTAEVATVMEKADWRFQQSQDFSLIDHTIALYKTGSHCYGTTTPESDADFMAIILPRMRHIVGLGKFEHFEPGPEAGIDVKGTSLHKFVKLALDGNPNVVELLFTEPDALLYVRPEFLPFIEHADAFLSREVYRRFSGYAAGQMKKMEAGKAAQWAGHKRKELVRQYGYDPKDASHLIRLLFKGIELAEQGTLTTKLSRSQRDIVLSIKQGLWPLEAVKAFAARLAERAEAAFHSSDCPLPEKPCTGFIEVLLMEAHRDAVA